MVCCRSDSPRTLASLLQPSLTLIIITQDAIMARKAARKALQPESEDDGGSEPGFDVQAAVRAARGRKVIAVPAVELAPPSAVKAASSSKSQTHVGDGAVEADDVAPPVNRGTRRRRVVQQAQGIDDIPVVEKLAVVRVDEIVTAPDVPRGASIPATTHAKRKRRGRKAKGTRERIAGDQGPVHSASIEVEVEQVEQREEEEKEDAAPPELSFKTTKASAAADQETRAAAAVDEIKKQR